MNAPAMILAIYAALETRMGNLPRAQRAAAYDLKGGFCQACEDLHRVQYPDGFRWAAVEESKLRISRTPLDSIAHAQRVVDAFAAKGTMPEHQIVEAAEQWHRLRIEAMEAA